MQGKISKATVEKLKPGEFLADTDCRGFTARKLPSGVITYGYRYRAAGKQRWFGLGVHGKVNPEQARKAAKVAAGKVATEGDPSGEKQARGEECTVNTLLDRYMKGCGDGFRSANQIRRAFDREVRPVIGTRSIYAIRRSEIMLMLDEIAIRGPVMADSVVAFLSVAFIWWAVRDDNFRNPIVRGMRRCKQKERARKRMFDDQEIRDLWAAADRLHTPKCFPDFVKILFLTARRRKELAGFSWAEVAAEAVDGKDVMLWTCPEKRNKTGEESGPLFIPLTPKVLALLGERRSGFRFCTGEGKVPLGGFHEPVVALRKAVDELRKEDGRPPMPHWSLHDLRRTAKSLMSRAGVPPRHSELCLGHAIPGVEGKYDRYAYLNEKLAAFEALGAMIERILDPAPGNVVPLHQQRTSKAA